MKLAKRVKGDPEGFVPVYVNEETNSSNYSSCEGCVFFDAVDVECIELGLPCNSDDRIENNGWGIIYKHENDNLIKELNNYFIAECFDDKISELVFWSFRYFIGRRSIRTYCFIQNLIKSFPYLDQLVKDMIKRELDEAFERDDEDRKRFFSKATKSGKAIFTLGDDNTREAWETLRKLIHNK